MRIDVVRPETSDLYRALDQYRQTCLAELRSAFLPPDDPNSAEVWTAGCASELVDRFIDRPDTSKRTFIEKLRDQLAQSSQQAVQLLVELAWLSQVVPPVVTVTCMMPVRLVQPLKESGGDRCMTGPTRPERVVAGFVACPNYLGRRGVKSCSREGWDNNCIEVVATAGRRIVGDER